MLGNRPIINMVFPVVNYSEGSPENGDFSFPFQMQLPEWLPASVIYTGDKHSAKMQIRYFLHAQFSPLN